MADVLHVLGCFVGAVLFVGVVTMVGLFIQLWVTLFDGYQWPWERGR